MIWHHFGHQNTSISHIRSITTVSCTAWRTRFNRSRRTSRPGGPAVWVNYYRELAWAHTHTISGSGRDRIDRKIGEFGAQSVAKLLKMVPSTCQMGNNGPNRTKIAPIWHQVAHFGHGPPKSSIFPLIRSRPLISGHQSVWAPPMGCVCFFLCA